MHAGGSLEELLYIADRVSLDHAADLISRYGVDAGIEAAARADRYRDLGNAVNFCRWRQIERMILVLTSDAPIGTIH